MEQLIFTAASQAVAADFDADAGSVEELQPDTVAVSTKNAAKKYFFIQNAYYSFFSQRNEESRGFYGTINSRLNRSARLIQTEDRGPRHCEKDEEEPDDQKFELL